MPDTVRVRIAPSPTGSPHIGTLRTALYNWLFARHTGGVFVVRVEDTDRARYQPTAEQEIFDSLRWLGLEWDEGPDRPGRFEPYRQSERLPIYRAYADRLVAEGKAYPCYCSPERLEEMRQEQQRAGNPAGYDRRCRNLTAAERAAHEAQGTASVIRFAVPLTGETTLTDLLRGPISFANELLDDHVLLKSDGFPTYHLAIVDDHEMRITHVLRGEEWISSAPRYLLLYEALGLTPPQFAHLPLILGKDRAKLGKRHGATLVTWYRDQGYLPEALLNFIALLGWSPGEDQEILSAEEMVSAFSLGAVGKSAAVFDVEKLDWMNGAYLRRLSIEELTARCLPYLQRDGFVSATPNTEELAYARQALALLQERLRVLGEVGEQSAYFFREDFAYEPAAVTKWLSKPETPALLQAVRARIAALAVCDEPGLEEAIRAVAEELGVGAGKVIHPVRSAVSGRTIGPSLFGMMAALGRERLLARLDRALVEFPAS